MGILEGPQTPGSMVPKVQPAIRDLVQEGLAAQVPGAAGEELGLARKPRRAGSAHGPRSRCPEPCHGDLGCGRLWSWSSVQQ